MNSHMDFLKFFDRVIVMEEVDGKCRIAAEGQVSDLLEN